MAVQQIAGRPHQYHVSGSGAKPYVVNFDNPAYPNCTCVNWKIMRNRQMSNGMPDYEFYECKHIEQVYRSTDEDKRVVAARRGQTQPSPVPRARSTVRKPAPVKKEESKEAQELEAEFERLRSIESLKQMRKQLLKDKGTE